MAAWQKDWQACMALSLSKESRERLELATPAIIFFASSANHQTEMLPHLEKEEKYDFPKGD